MLPSRIALALTLAALPALGAVTGDCKDTYYNGIEASGTECAATIPNDSYNPLTCRSPGCTPTECWDTADTSTNLNSSANDSTDCWARYRFHDPAFDPVTGAGVQSFRVKACRKYTTQTGNPDVTLTLYESGTSRTTTNSGTITTNCGSGYDTVTLTWDASDLTDATGDGVEVLVEIPTSGGGPTARNTARVAFVEWVISMNDPPAETVFTISSQPRSTEDVQTGR